jgi:chromosome segregation ATPase
MSVNLEAAITENIDELRQAISDKSLEVAQLEKELKRYENALNVLRDGTEDVTQARRGKGGRRRKTDLSTVLGDLPETFTSKDFIKAATRTRKPSVYLRLALSRWTKEGRLKRLERGKYQKVRGGSHRMAA